MAEEEPKEDTLNIEARKTEAKKRAEKRKTPAMEEDFIEWDKLMRQRLVVKIQKHQEEIRKEFELSEEKDNPEAQQALESTLKKYNGTIEIIENKNKAPRYPLLFDMFASAFQQMDQEGEVSFGEDMANYHQFRDKFFVPKDENDQTGKYLGVQE